MIMEDVQTFKPLNLRESLGNRRQKHNHNTGKVHQKNFYFMKYFQGQIAGNTGIPVVDLAPDILEK